MKSIHLKYSAIIAFVCLFASQLFAQQMAFMVGNYDAYLPEIKKMNQQIAFFHADVSTPAGLAYVRKIFGPPGGKTILKPQDRFVNGSKGNIRIRIIRPDIIKAVVYDFHGGAWIAGKPESNDSLNDVLARYCNVAVVSVDFHLAPENPYDLQIQDCDSVAAWLLKNSYSEFGTNKLILSGSGSGAQLAAHTLLDIRDKFNSINQVIGINLFYGAFDLSGTPSVRQVKRNSLVLDSAFIAELGIMVFPGKSREELRSPYYSPLYADLRGLPPALFSVGTLDPLLDDTMFMSDRWEAAGNLTTLFVYPECPNAFNYFATQIAKLANQREGDWINSLLK